MQTLILEHMITSGASVAIYGLTFGQYVTKAIDPWVCLQSEGAEYAVQLMIGTCFISEWCASV
jgi:hypothetical protein